MGLPTCLPATHHLPLSLPLCYAHSKEPYKPMAFPWLVRGEHVSRTHAVYVKDTKENIVWWCWLVDALIVRLAFHTVGGWQCVWANTGVSVYSFSSSPCLSRSLIFTLSARAFMVANECIQLVSITTTTCSAHFSVCPHSVWPSVEP